MSGYDKRGKRMTKEERLGWLKRIEKDIYVSSLESTFADDSKSCAIHSIIEELEQEPTAKNDLGVDCISRESVIAIIQNHWWNCRDIDKLVNALPSVTPQETRWIPVTERFPNDSGRYLVNYSSGYVAMAYYYEAVSKWSSSTTERIIAWMPLPEPYKEVKK